MSSKRAEIVGADLAAVGDGQQDPQAAGERGVLGGLLRRAVASGGHGLGDPGSGNE